MSYPRLLQVVELVFDNGLLLNALRPNILRFMPALNVSQGEIDGMIEILKQSLVAAAWLCGQK